MLKHLYAFYKKTLNSLNNKGLSIVEIMVAAGLASIISLGIATMIQNMFEQRKRAMLMNTMRDLKTRIETNIRDNSSWTHIMANNAGLACLRTNIVCTASYTDPPNSRNDTPAKIVLYDTAGNVTYDLLTWGDAGTNGFTEIGGPCTTFSAAAGAGTDACPFSYRLVYNMWCPAFAATCTNPQLKISGRLIFNPAANGILNRFRGIINTGSLTVTADGPNIDGRYDPVVKRTAIDTNITFRLAARKATGGAANDNLINHCGTEGAGSCSVGGLAVHPLTWDEVSDTQDLVTVSGSSVTFNANQGGPVHCTVSVPAFGTMGFTAELFNSTDSITMASATTVAGEWSMSTAIIDTKFVAVPGKAYVVRQQCQQWPSGPAAGAVNCTLGFHTQPYDNGAQDVMTMNCVRLDKTL